MRSRTWGPITATQTRLCKVSCFLDTRTTGRNADDPLRPFLGQNLYTNGAKGDSVALQNMDKQIYRLIGKATTLAAMAYRVRQGREFVVPPTGMSYTESYVPSALDMYGC